MRLNLHLRHRPCFIFALLAAMAASGCASGPGGATIPSLRIAPFQETLGGGGDDAADFWQLDAGDRQFAKAEQLGDNRFRFKVRDFEKHARKQTTAETCWAACAALVLGMRRDTVDERHLTELITGGNESKTATLDGITRALVYRQEKLFQNSLVRTGLAPVPLTNEEFIESIARNRPVVVGYVERPDDDEGHVVVAVGVEFRRLRPSTFSKQVWQVVSIDAFDPYPGEPDRMTLDHAALVQKVQFTVTPETARKAVQEWQRKRR